jgi:hypothetical protein
MPNYKNGKVLESRFKAQILIRSKGHLDFQQTNFYKRVPSLTCYSIESSQSLKVRIFLQVENPNDRCE